MKIADLTKDQIEDLISKHSSIRQMLESIGVNSNGSGAYKTLRNHCERIGVKLPKFKRNGRFSFGVSEKIPLEDILIENSAYQNRSSLKRRLINEGVLVYKCEECGISEWRGKKISLQLEHQNGVNNDNRLENLSLLCPNCHSQTKTFAGRNTKVKHFCSCGKIKTKEAKKCKYCSKKENKTRTVFYRKVKERPTAEELEKMLEKTSFVAIGKEYGVSDNAVRKWAKKYGII